MVGRILGMLGALLAYLCIGTVIAQCIGLVVLSRQGGLSRDNIAQALAILQGADINTLVSAAAGEQTAEPAEQVSLEDIALARARLERDLELREQSIITQLDQIRFERAQLTDESARYRALASQFQQQLDTLRGEVIDENQEGARLILENIKPKQAKEQLMVMVTAGEMDEAVRLLSAMPVTKQSKLIAEFKTPEESAALAEMLRRIREGQPAISAIDDATRRFDGLGAAPQDSPGQIAESTGGGP